MIKLYKGFLKGYPRCKSLWSVFCFLAIIFLGSVWPIVSTSHWLLCINCFTSLGNSDNDLQVALLLGGPSSSWFLVKLELEMLIFEERGKPEYLEKNLPEQRREPTHHVTREVHRFLHRVWAFFNFIVNMGSLKSERIDSTETSIRRGFCFFKREGVPFLPVS